MISRSHGLKAWLIQRLSAVYMAVYLAGAIFCLSVWPPQNYPQWRALVAVPAVSVATLLFFGMLLVHAWVGVRDVVMDYVHAYALRFALLALVAGGLVAMGIWVLQVITGTW